MNKDFAHSSNMQLIALELRAFQLLDSEDVEALRHAAAQAFQMAKSLESVESAESALDAATTLIRISCLGILGNCDADVRQLLLKSSLILPVNDSDWKIRVSANVLFMWLRLFQKDFEAVQQQVARLRADQHAYEQTFVAEQTDTRAVWKVMSHYHLARAAEILSMYLSGEDRGDDIYEQLNAQFDYAISTASRSQQMEQEVLARLLARTAQALVQNVNAPKLCRYCNSPLLSWSTARHAWLCLDCGTEEK